MLDPRSPVLVGVGSLTQRGDDLDALAEPVELMRRAAQAAAADAAAPGLLGHVGLVLVPKGIWDYANVAGRLAAALGAPARTVVGEVGILQQTLITRACTDIAAGRVDAALVCGGEARHRAQLAGRQGRAAAETEAPGAPDELLLPDGEIISGLEIERDLAVPAHQYALVESVLRHLAGRTAEEQAAHLGRLWASFGEVAAANPQAWDRSAPDGPAIATPAPDNRMIASPYTKRLCSQWNVDQAAALLLTSAEGAEAAGVPRDRWIFPGPTAESQAMVPLAARADVHRSLGTARAGRAALDAAGLDIDDVTHLDIYSCFPAAVQVQAHELGLPLDERPLTVTGGMTFAGGPLNSYVVHSTAAMAQVLRADPSSVGVVTAVSGMLTKPAVALWSGAPWPNGFQPLDVTAETHEAIGTRTVEPDGTGPATVVAHTTIHERGVPSRTVALVELASGARTVAVDRDAGRAAATATLDGVGAAVELTEPGVFAGW